MIPSEICKVLLQIPNYFWPDQKMIGYLLKENYNLLNRFWSESKKLAKHKIVWELNNLNCSSYYLNRIKGCKYLWKWKCKNHKCRIKAHKGMCSISPKKSRQGLSIWRLGWTFKKSGCFSLPFWGWYFSSDVSTHAVLYKCPSVWKLYKIK